MRYDRATKLIHWGLAVLMVGQLLTEEFMKRPKPGRIRTEAEAWFFETHEWIGVILLALVVLRFIFILDRSEWAKLFPWATGEGLRGIVGELKELPRWLTGKLPGLDAPNYIARTVHGLGLLLAAGLGTSGTVILIEMSPAGVLSAFGSAAKELHELLGSLLWIYVIGHAGMALVHQLFGHKALQRIFSLKD